MPPVGTAINPRPGSCQGGFSLVEVLVAMLVLGIGLLGLAALQITGLKANESARVRTEVSLAAYDLADRLRADTRAFFPKGQGSKGIISIDAGDCPGEGATDAVGRWREAFCALGLREPAENSLASVDCQDSNPCGGGNCAIIIRWNDGRAEGVDSADKAFEFCTRLPTTAI